MATMADVKSLMKQAGWGALATSDGKTVSVRPMAGWAWVDGELWCATGKVTDKVAQLSRVPQAEYCFTIPTGQHVRIAGHCLVSTDNADKARLYEMVPVLKQHVSDPTDPEYVVLRLTPDRIRAMFDLDMSYTEVTMG